MEQSNCKRHLPPREQSAIDWNQCMHGFPLYANGATLSQFAPSRDYNCAGRCVVTGYAAAGGLTWGLGRS
jgi:hypothetical protein